jgi:large subunit ribosomal protein L31
VHCGAPKTIFLSRIRAAPPRRRAETDTKIMKASIHPNYVDCSVRCGCGNEFQTRATVKELKIEICSVCHPFYTGNQKFVDAAGRVDRFKRKFAKKGQK